MQGTVFDIKEFSVYDGPGVRVTVFLKGCPLRCKWCHNPEGLSPHPEVMVSSGCTHCNACHSSDCSKEALGTCSGCGECVIKCPNALRKVSGKAYTPKELADAVMKYAVFLDDGGGVTFSGGEPTVQADFLCETMSLIPLHKAVQTCGYCKKEDFERVINSADLVFFDIKHTDPVIHKEYTGVSNELILKNLELLKASKKPFICRIPLIKGVNDSYENLKATADLLKDCSSLIRVELLPYNAAAGAKYKMVGKDFTYDFTAPEKESIDLSVFTDRKIDVRFM